MSSSPTRNTIGTRFAIMALSILALSLAILNSIIMRFAIVLRGRARLDLTESGNVILARSFQQLMGKVLEDVLIAALASALSVIVGVTLVAYPRWLRGNSNLPIYYGAMQPILSLFVLVTGAYLADHVYGFQSSFAEFQGDDHIPYYSIMYYGGIGEAVYGTLMILIGAGSLVVLLKFGN